MNKREIAMLESNMEDLLIKQLTCDISQWTYRSDLKTEEDLWNNFREKLNRNNIDKLDGKPLTNSEMAQIKQFLLDQAKTTYTAARWLSGEHQVAQIPLLRDDASVGEISLMAVNSREIAGGNSSYEVINQYQATNDDGSERNRRFDVTLLINGLPLIHIELKNGDHPYMDAFRQIKKYCEEGKFRGLMGLVQMFIVSNGEQTRYIAADNYGKMNEKFLTRWVDENNEPVENYLAFAKAALNIPAAHLMVGKYCVLDNERKKVILLRPYQIHAIEAIRKASRDRQSGFIWHTTGSGKTLTSYTVTKNLLDIPSTDKAIFLIDRKDLDQQTTSSFLSYADSDDVDVRNTEHTGDLENKLKNKDRCAIVTTIQKLQNIIRRCNDENANKHYQQLKKLISKKTIAFVVDECHRAVTPESKRIIENFFARSLWYGFTGTPIFEENKREQKGDLPRTTAGMYGRPDDPNKKCLHSYTIKEAIGDGAVLGFKVQGMGFRRCTLEELVKTLQIMDSVQLEDISDKDLEGVVVKEYAKKTGRSIYDDDRHRLDVIDYIVNKCASKLWLQAPTGEAFEGLLTVNSIQDAQHYYKLFKQFIKDGKVSEDVKKYLPDFPKIAITYTVGENEDGATANQTEMKASIDDYNAMFGTSWDLSTIGAYNSDLNDRLARKKSKYKDRDQQLDLVIVVDRLLTGFDAPCLSTIFLDRPPMKPHHLVQAFSRTNRIFNAKKRYGHIVTFQTPELFAQKIDEALKLYTNGGMSDVQAPSWEETSAKLQKAIENFREIAPTIEEVDQIQKSNDLDALCAFAKTYQALDRLIGEAQVYDEFRDSMLGSQFPISREEFERYTARYQNVIEKIRELKITKPVDPIDVDVDYELESVKQIEVNYRYLVALLQVHMPEGTEAPKVMTNAEDKRISKFIEDYKKANAKVGEVLSQIWFEIKLNPEGFRDQDAFVLIEQRVDDLIETEIKNFSAKWGVNPDALKAFANTVPASEISSKTVDSSMGDFAAFKAAGGSGTKLRYLRELREAVATFVKDEIKPLTKR